MADNEKDTAAEEEGPVASQSRQPAAAGARSKKKSASKKQAGRAAAADSQADTQDKKQDRLKEKLVAMGVMAGEEDQATPHLKPSRTARLIGIAAIVLVVILLIVFIRGPQNEAGDEPEAQLTGTESPALVQDKAVNPTASVPAGGGAYYPYTGPGTYPQAGGNTGVAGRGQSTESQVPANSEAGSSRSNSPYPPGYTPGYVQHSAPAYPPSATGPGAFSRWQPPPPYPYRAPYQNPYQAPPAASAQPGRASDEQAYQPAQSDQQIPATSNSENRPGRPPARPGWGYPPPGYYGPPPGHGYGYGYGYGYPPGYPYPYRY